MTATTTPPRRPSPGERRARRERLTTLITISVVLVVCTAAGLGAYAMSNSWWVQGAPSPAADQQLADGQSRFDRAGVDFFNRQRLATVDVVDPAPASDLGLPSDGDTPIETLVPLAVEVRGAQRVLTFPGVSSFVLTTSGDRLAALTVTPAASSAWMAIRGDLEQRSAEWGWSPSDLEDLERKVGDAGREEGVAQTMALPAASVDGMTALARVTVDVGGRISLQYVFAP